MRRSSIASSTEASALRHAEADAQMADLLRKERATAQIPTQEAQIKLVRPKRDPRAEAMLWVERLTLTNFRNYAHLALEAGPEPQVLIGANGAGKTNLLEAVSLLGARPGPAPRGLSRARARSGRRRLGGRGARAHGLGPVDIGTGLPPRKPERAPGRIVRINGAPAGGSGALADYVELVWVTPAMDSLFTGPASERRRFLDRLILCFDPGYRTRVGRFERAMAAAQPAARRRRARSPPASRASSSSWPRPARRSPQRAPRPSPRWPRSRPSARARDPPRRFPPPGWRSRARSRRTSSGWPAVEVEDGYAQLLRDNRERDRAAGRTLDGPHRSDLIGRHAAKAMPARLCSTGEQKALLLGLVLAHAELVAERHDGVAPILLLDEVTAHLDAARRAALFAEILRLGARRG